MRKEAGSSSPPPDNGIHDAISICGRKKILMNSR